MFIDNDISDKIFELAGIEKQSEELTQSDVKRALIEIERKLNFFSTTSLMHKQDKFNVLIVDDLELSIYQFTQMFKKLGSTPNVARSKEEAMAEIRKRVFDYVIVDLYLPDLSDGLTLITELLKYKKTNNQKFKIISISSTDEQQIIQQVYSLGVDEFIAKSPNWHNEVLHYIANSITPDNKDFSTFICENDICVYSLNHLHTQEQVKNLLENISTSVYADKPNIILNTEKMISFDEEYTPMFSQIYKTCQNAGGEFVILSPSTELRNALKNAFLDGLIKTATSIQEAIHIIKNR